jgi:hypothetical protein
VQTPTTWLDVAQQAVPLVAALLVLFGVWLTVRQKDRVDHKEQWWQRVQWSADLVMSRDENRQLIGMSALVSLIDHLEAVDRSDAGMLQSIIDQVDVESHRQRAVQGHGQ